MARHTTPGHSWRPQQTMGARARKRLAKHYKMECVFCGGPAETVDHLVPRSRGGTSDVENLRPCCIPCNRDKASLTPYEWLKHLCPFDLIGFDASPEFPPRPEVLRAHTKPRKIAALKRRREFHANAKLVL